MAEQQSIATIEETALAKKATSGDTPEVPAPVKASDPPPGEPQPIESVAKPLTWYEAISKDDDEATKKAIASEVASIIAKHKLDNYVTLLLFDEADSIVNYHADRLYAAASPFKESGKDILLIVQSNGGRIEPAYLISKTLRRISGKKFVVAVPRRAKSAATLISLGADEIHMGMMSQLGPIDPQLHGLPVLAPGNALDVIAGLTSRFPATSEMFTKYLTDQVPIRLLGYYQRVGESAEQYAERLLANKKLPDGKTAKQIANHLVNHYKDHDFVIDFDEAQSLLGSDIVKQGTIEYAAATRYLDF